MGTTFTNITAKKPLARKIALRGNGGFLFA